MGVVNDLMRLLNDLMGGRNDLVWVVNALVAPVNALMGVRNALTPSLNDLARPVNALMPLKNHFSVAKRHFHRPKSHFWARRRPSRQDSDGFYPHLGLAHELVPAVCNRRPWRGAVRGGSEQSTRHTAIANRRHGFRGLQETETAFCASTFGSGRGWV